MELTTLAIAGTIGAGIGGLIGWIVALRGMSREDAKARREALESLHVPREKFNEACDQLANSLITIRALLHSTPVSSSHGQEIIDKIASGREASLLLFRKSVDLSRNMFELELLLADDNAARQDKVVSDLCAQLDDFASWHTVLNSDALTSSIGRAAFVFSDTTLRKFLDLTIDLPDSIRLHAKQRVEDALRPMRQVGQIPVQVQLGN